MGTKHIIKKVNLDEITKDMNDNYRHKINWEKSINKTIPIVFNDGTEVIARIIDVKFRKGNYNILFLQYNDEIIEISTRILLDHSEKKENFKIKKSISFRKQINDIIKNDIQDLIIIDREIRLGKNNIKRKWYKYHCNLCGHEDWKEESGFEKGTGCCACGKGRFIIQGINDIPTTTPWLIPYFQGGYDEAKKYKCNSNEYIYPVCPDCGRIKSKKMTIKSIHRTKTISCSCSDGISAPNKFAFNLLEQIGIEFINEYTPNWIGRRLYDFYFKINNKEYILEMDGGLGHGNNIVKGKSKLTSEETLDIDDEKDRLAEEHGIEVIRINCNYPSIDVRFEYIKNNILNSKINELFDLSKIDWNKIEEFILSNRIKEACTLWDDGIHSTEEIAKIMKMAQGTINTYIKQGSKIGWCEYSSDEIDEKRKLNIKKKCSKPILCTTNENIFLSVVDCIYEMKKQFNVQLTSPSISMVCHGISNHTNGYQFKYIEDLTPKEYIKYGIENKLKELSNQELIQAI